MRVKMTLGRAIQQWYKYAVSNGAINSHKLAANKIRNNKGNHL
jgi:hypothetical protein